MNNQGTEAYAKAILQRALTQYGDTTGNLAPTDPLDIAGIKAVAAELDVPARYVDDALTTPVITPPALHNAYTLTVARYLWATPEAVIRSGRPLLRERHHLQVIAPTPHGIALEPIDGITQSNATDQLASLRDLALECHPLGLGQPPATPPVNLDHPDTDQPGTVVLLRGQVAHPASAMAASALGMGLGFGAIPGLLLLHFTPIGSELSGIIALIGIVITAIIGAGVAYRFWLRSVNQVTLRMVGVLDRIDQDLNTRRTEQPQVSMVEEAGSVLGRFMRGYHQARWCK